MNKRVLTRASGDPDSLVELLSARLGVDARQAKAWITAGSVYVGGKRIAAPCAVAIGDKLTVFIAAPAAPTSVPTIIHQDDWMAVLDKPPGMASQAEVRQRSAALDAFALRTFGPDARMLHRLDKEASGLVLFALVPRALAPLQAALESGAIDRRYVALVDGELRGEGTIRLRIARHPEDRRLRAALPENAPAGEVASSHYRSLAHATWKGRHLSALELTLETGRTHQLRVHLSAHGHPIVGDNAYRGPAFQRLCLHAHALEVPHPRDGDRLRLSAPLPESFATLVPGLTRPFT
ncbi:MAG: rluA [Myxococcales bacterium]|nr:rluA [Myxococcales bacterium]